MRLQHLRAPALPLPKQRRQFFGVVQATAEELLSAWRRTGARVEQCDVDLTPGERLIQHRQVADDESQKRESDPGLQHDQPAPEPRSRNNITETKGEERLAAQVQVVHEGAPTGNVEAGTEAALQERKPHDETRRPCAKQYEQRQRPEEAQVSFAPCAHAHLARHRRPDSPGDAIKHARGSKTARYASRQHDCLERVPYDDEYANGASRGYKQAHQCWDTKV